MEAARASARPTAGGPSACADSHPNRVNASTGACSTSDTMARLAASISASTWKTIDLHPGDDSTEPGEKAAQSSREAGSDHPWSTGIGGDCGCAVYYFVILRPILQRRVTPVDTQVSPVDGMTMVYVPAGKFWMGSRSGDISAYSEEQPQHEVYLDAFWIDRSEVTNAMYARCVADGACQPPSDTSSNTRDAYYGEAQYADYPVIYVFWSDAEAYCRWAGRQLPTEAQWEKAERGDDRRKYPWGNLSPKCGLANWYECVGDTSQVGGYPAGASPYGALDMAGNVWEWVADWYDSSYYSSSPSSNPTGPESGQYRVLRGGSWGYWADTPRTASRFYALNFLSYTVNNYGFRCARSP